MNSNLTTDLKVKWKPPSLLEDTIGVNVDNFEFGNDILDTTPKAQSVKKKIEKLNFIKSNNFSWLVCLSGLSASLST